MPSHAPALDKAAVHLMPSLVLPFLPPPTCRVCRVATCVVGHSYILGIAAHTLPGRSGPVPGRGALHALLSRADRATSKDERLHGL